MNAYLLVTLAYPISGLRLSRNRRCWTVNGTIALTAGAHAAFDPELVVPLPITTTVFYDVMPPFCLGIGRPLSATSAAPSDILPMPTARWRSPAPRGDQRTVSIWRSPTVPGGPRLCQPLEFLLRRCRQLPVLPVFINGVTLAAAGLSAYPHAGRSHWPLSNRLNKRVVILGSGGPVASAAGTEPGEGRCPYARPAAGQRQAAITGRRECASSGS